MIDGFSDSHLHADGMGYAGSEQAALLSVCAAAESDWDAISSVEDGRVVKSFGTHPWHSDGWGDGSIGRLRAVLEEHPGVNVGEIGLDADTGPDMVLQARCFEEQFALASELGRAVTIHNLRCESWVLASIKRNHKGCRAVVLHSFTGPDSYVGSYSKYGCYFSISPRLLSRNRDRAATMLSKIPMDRLLIETDAPHMGAGFTSTDQFISDLAQLMSIEPGELVRITSENARKAFR